MDGSKLEGPRQPAVPELKALKQALRTRLEALTLPNNPLDE